MPTSGTDLPAYRKDKRLVPECREVLKTLDRRSEGALNTGVVVHRIFMPTDPVIAF